MRQSIVRITTIDGKTYEFPSKDPIPQLWEVQLKIAAVTAIGNSYTPSDRPVSVFVRRQILVDHGLVPESQEDRPRPTPAPTAEDLLLQLLEYVGVYPE